MTRMTRGRTNVVAALVVAAGLSAAVLTGCRREEAAAPPPPPEVAVLTVQPRQVSLTTELPGRVVSFRQSEIRPRVSGLILQRLFEEGTIVKAGDVLYQIDPAPFQVAHESALAALETARKAADGARAALNAAEADVHRHKANLDLARTLARRQDQLMERGAGSAIEHDKATTDLQVAQANLRVAEAQVLSARAAVASADAAVRQAEAAVNSTALDLSYTRVTAPIEGRIGRSNVTEGAMVTAYQPLALATIQTLDPVYVDVPQSTVELNRLRRSLAAGRLSAADEAGAVRIKLEDGTTHAHVGTLKFRDVTVDPTTGSVILRIVVPNPDGVLLPGMFVRAEIEEAVDPQAILVPQQAVMRNSRGEPYVLRIDAEGKVEQHAVKVDRAIGNEWLVNDGLSAGERIIVEGVQRVRPGASPRIVAWTPPGQPDAPAAAVSSAAGKEG